MKRLLIVAAVACIALLTVSATQAAKGPGGNSLNAKSCQKGGWQSLYTRTGVSFASEQACTSYAAQKGTQLINQAALACLSDGWKSRGPTSSTAFASEQECVDFVLAGGSPATLQADISVTAVVFSCSPNPGCTYRFTVSNAGPGGATVTMKDTCLSGTYTVGAGAPWSQVFPEPGHFHQGFIAAGSSASYVASCSFGTGGFAQVYSSSAPDPDSTPNNGVTTEDDYVEFFTYPA